MPDQTLLQRMKDWGYDLLPRPHPASPGYGGLIVAIRERPSQQHFDPETLELWLVDSDETLRRANFSLNTIPAKMQRVGPGQLTLRDRVDKRIKFFTFGGSLETMVSPGETIYTLTSPAPVLELTQYRQLPSDQLFAEVELLLAKLKATSRLNDTEFDQRLARLDPFQLYLAGLQAILACYQSNRALRNQWRGFYQQLVKEKTQLVQAGQWPTDLPNLATLLGFENAP